MRLNIVTIVLDGEPYIERHLPEFEKLDCEWHWFVVEGASDNTKDQSWCKKQQFRLSQKMVGFKHKKVPALQN